AKELLLNAREMAIPEKPVLKTKDETPDAPIEDERKTVHEVKKLPQNYLESKFLLEATTSEVEKAKKDNKDVGLAQSQLELARQYFDSGDYSGSLKECMRARRALSNRPSEPGKAAVERISGAKKVILPSEERIVLPVPKTGMNDVCLKCGESLVPDDNFCGKCGEKAVLELKCPGCGNPRAENDTFCRKCGTRYE
ncbi:MAG TPA: zinc ribbon domain-containing protein, partial [Methanomassiliicoccales archaeon]|nr:zinc ribbon domain-containing protein [Methanomassiliicoccales archaeon]